MASKATKLNVEVNGSAVYATPQGIRLGSRGKVQEPVAFFRSVSKRLARQTRKALRRAGRKDFSGISVSW